MKKIMFLVVAVVLMASCAKTEEKTVEQPKKVVKPVATNEKPLEKSSEETEKQNEEIKKPPEVPKNRILLNAQTENLPDLSTLLDTKHPLKPEIVNLPTDVIWERGGKIVDVETIDCDRYIITDNSQYKSKVFDIELLDEIGATKTSHGFGKGIIGNINYDNYISADNYRIACTDDNITEVYDIKTNRLIYKYESRKLERPSNDFVCCSKLSGDELFIGNPYEIICINLTSSDEKYRISFESLGKDDYLKPDSIRFVSFIGKINDSMYVFTKGSKIAIYKVTSDGKATILYSTSEVGESSYDDPLFPLYNIWKNDVCIFCINNGSVDIIEEIKCNDEEFMYDKYPTPTSGFKYWRFLVTDDFIFDLETRKPIIRIKKDSDRIKDIRIYNNLLLARIDNVMYTLDLQTLKTEWSFKLDGVLEFLPNYKSNQVSIRVDYKNILYFFPDNPTKMWKLDMKKVKVAQHRDDEKTSNHISTAFVGINGAEKTWFDQNENKVYISGWTSFCLGDNSEVNPLVFPTISDWCFDRNYMIGIEVASMDIFVRWNGSNAVKASVKCKSPDKTMLKSEIMLESGKLTRLKVWFDDNGQVLTIGSNSYNIYINPSWCGD